MNNLEDELVPYTESLILKELGFNDSCFGYYNEFKTFISEIDKTNANCNKLGMHGKYCTAPIFSQAFKFFRKNHKLTKSITDFINNDDDIEWDYEIVVIGTDLDKFGNYKPLIEYSIDDENRKFKTYEATELECLKKLIEIVKKD